MAKNLPLGFASVFIGGILIVMGFTGDSLASVVKGDITVNPIDTSSSTSDSTATAASAGGGGGSSGSTPSGLSPLEPPSGDVANTGTAGSGIAKFSAAQQTFAKRLAADTGLNINVILGWMQNEQPPGSASAPNGVNNWLNIGATGSGYYGGSNPAWASPLSAADETATWLKGNAIDGYGGASSGIRAILSTAGQSIEAQVRAIQTSGWSGSGYPDLLSIVQSIAG